MTINWKIKILSALPFLALATHALRAQPADVQPANAVPPASTLERAFIYAFPIYEMMRVRWNYIEDPRNPLRSGVNEIAPGDLLYELVHQTKDAISPIFLHQPVGEGRHDVTPRPRQGVCVD